MALGALVAVQQLASLPQGSSLLRAVQDALHAPWFFCVVVVLCWYFRTWRFVPRLLVVAAIAGVLAVGSEAVQLYVESRSASVQDLWSNLAGGALGFVFATALLGTDHEGPLLRLGVGRVLLGLAVLLVLALFTIRQPWQVLELRAYRAELFPVLADFADARASDYLSTNTDSHFRLGKATDLWPQYSGKQVLRLQFGEQEYPTLYINESLQRWVPHEELAIDVFVLDNEPLPLTVAVQYEGSAGTSAYVEQELQPGENRWRIDRSRLVPDEATGLRVRDVLIYTTRQNAGRAVLLGGVWLQ